MKSKRTKRKNFTFRNWFVEFSWAAKKTRWYFNLETSSRTRMDCYFNISRLYSRKYQDYVTLLVFGKLCIMVANLEED